MSSVGSAAKPHGQTTPTRAPSQASRQILPASNQQENTNDMRHHTHHRPHHWHDTLRQHGRHEHPPSQRFARDPLDGGGRQHRHGGPRGPGGGRRRLFDHGDLRFILLGMIANRPAHGYDLIKALEDRMGGGYSPSPGVIYPTLTMLEEQGYAQGTAEDGKKLYQATPQGQAFLQANQPQVEAIEARISGLARQRNVVLDPRIIRAMENLRTALRLRLNTGALPDAQVRAIAAAIDAAATEVEN